MGVGDQGQSTSQGIDSAVNHTCEVCNKTLPSRNKLFQHIKETGHAMVKPVPAGGNATGSEKKRNKKKRTK